MAQLTSRKTITRAGVVATTAAGGTYIAHRAFGDTAAGERAGIVPATIAAALVAGGASAFFETQDTA